MERKQFLKTLALFPLAACTMKIKDLQQMAEELPATKKTPLVFIGHGDPMNALRDNPFTQSLKKQGNELKNQSEIKAILVLSAHWLTKGSYVQKSAKPEIIYDFGGFPDELYKVKYPALGSPTAAEAVSSLNAKISTTEEWGLDHGAWMVLKHMFPEADMPVFQMSLDYTLSMQQHFELAGTLKQLREKGVLILSSGNVVHNLGLSMNRYFQGDYTPFDWAIEFDNWIKMQTDKQDYASLVNYTQAGSIGTLSVPTTDHYIPLIYSAGLAEKTERWNHFYEEVLTGISMRCMISEG